MTLVMVLMNAPLAAYATETGTIDDLGVTVKTTVDITTKTILTYVNGNGETLPSDLANANPNDGFYLQLDVNLASVEGITDQVQMICNVPTGVTIADDASIESEDVTGSIEDGKIVLSWADEAKNSLTARIAFEPYKELSPLYNLAKIGNDWYRLRKTSIKTLKKIDDYVQGLQDQKQREVPVGEYWVDDYDFENEKITIGDVTYSYAESKSTADRYTNYYTVDFENGNGGVGTRMMIVAMKKKIGGMDKNGNIRWAIKGYTYDDPNETNSFHRNYIITLHKAETRKYTVKFVNWNGTKLQSSTLVEGTMPTYNGSTPVKSQDAEFTYEFIGWDSEIEPATSDKVYTAQYKAIRRSYTVTWRQDDGTLINTTTVEYGATPTHADPVKADDDKYSYTFAGWSSALAPVKKDVTYKATYTSTPLMKAQPLYNMIETTGQGSDGRFYRLDVQEGGIIAKDISLAKMRQAADPSEYTLVYGEYNFEGVTLTVNGVDYIYSDTELTGEHEAYFTATFSLVRPQDRIHDDADWLKDERGWVEQSKSTYPEPENNSITSYHADYIAVLHPSTIPAYDYTIHHYLRGTTTPVKGDETGRADVGTTVSADLETAYQGLTLTVATEEAGRSMTIGRTGNELTIEYSLPLTITPIDNGKVYGGNDPDLEATVTGKLANDTVTYKVVRESGDNAGEYDMTVEDVSAPRYYDVDADGTGTFTISAAGVTLVANSDETLVYTGEAQTVGGFEVYQGETKLEGLSFTGVSASATETDAGGYDVTFTGVIANTTTDTTGNYVVTDATGGRMVIAEREITVTVKDAIPVQYDGSTHAGMDLDSESFSNVVSGHIPTITYKPAEGRLVGEYKGSYKNDLKITDAAGNNVTSNYILTEKTVGKLNIIDRSVKYPITVTAQSSIDNVYDGQEKSAEGFVNAELLFKVDGLWYQVSGLTTSNPKSTDVITTKNRITGTAVVKDMDGKDVTAQFDVTTEDGDLIIAPKSVSVKPRDTQNKTYGAADPDFNAEANVEINGLVPGESRNLISYSVTRESGDEVGTYALTADGATEQGNYLVTFGDSTFEILSPDTVVVQIRADHEEATYDGEEHAISGYEIVNISNALLAESDISFKATEALADAHVSTTDVYTENGAAARKYMGLKPDNFANTNENFEKVRFEILEDGYVLVTPRTVVLASASDTKVYDGEALTRNEQTDVEADPEKGLDFVDGEGATYTITGRQTEVGSSGNVFDYTLNAGTKAVNYNITTAFGTLTVTPAAVATHTLTVTYVDENGNVVDTFTNTYLPGATYTITTPDRPGYTPDRTTVFGAMGDGDTEEVVTYIANTYTLTIRFVSIADGKEVMDPVQYELRAGDRYDIEINGIPGYDPLVNRVTGTMDAHDRPITMLMIPEGMERPTTIDIDEYGTPLGIAESILGSGEIIE